MEKLDKLQHFGLGWGPVVLNVSSAELLELQYACSYSSSDNQRNNSVIT